MKRLFSGAFLLAVACATTPKPEVAPPPRPDERSSIDVLLRHRSELNLTEDQITRLEALDQKRESEAESLRSQLGERQRAHKEAGVRPQQQTTTPADNAPAPGMGRGGMGAARGRGPAMGRGQGDAMREANEMYHLLDRIDEADTRSFVDAHSQVLTEEQRPQAEKLASDYRARLFDYREAMRKLHPHLPTE